MNHSMKRCKHLLVFFVALVLPCMLLAGEQTHKPITMELMQLLKADKDMHNMLAQSIALAKAHNPDVKTNPVRSVADYYNFIDRYVELLPQQIVKGPAGSVRDQMLQGICYFYYLVDQPLPELKDKGLYKNSLQYYPPFSAWLRKCADAWGDFLDSEASWTPAFYKQIYNDAAYGLQQGWYESPDNWKTFNQWFARFLKSPDVRPIASPEDPSVVVSPADSVPQGAWHIDGQSRIHVPGGLKVKMVRYFSIKDLLGEDSAYAGAFANGTLTHTFLNVNDYHRYHFAVSGTVKEVRIIAQNVALEVAWNPQQGKYVPIDSTGWQFTQTRGYVIVDTGTYGLVALIPMGMAQVSSVNFEQDVKAGSSHKKGDMLGNFLFGGSDFIMLFQQKAGFELTVAPMHTFAEKHGSDRHRKVEGYEHLLMGEAYGIMHGPKK